MAFLNETGLTRLWENILFKLNGKVNVEEGKGLSTNDFTTEEKEKLAALEMVNADWNQNDESAKDYIKNRTHWTEGDGKQAVLIEEQEVTLMLPSDMGESQQGDTVRMNYLTCANEDQIVTGDRVVVNFNNTIYEYEIKYDDFNGLYIGNHSLINSNVEDTGEPFVYWFDMSYLICPLETDSTVIFSARIDNNVIHKIDSKYLPDDIGSSVISDWNQNDETADDYIKNRTHWKEGESATLLENQETALLAYNNDWTFSNNVVCQGDFTWEMEINLPQDFVMQEGQNLTVIFGEETFTSALQADTGTEGNYYWTGNTLLSEMVEGNTPAEVEGEDYCFEILPIGGVYYFRGFFKIGKFPIGDGTSANPYYSITATIDSTVYHQLDEEFIPVAIARQADLAELKNYVDNMDVSLPEDLAYLNQAATFTTLSTSDTTGSTSTTTGAVTIAGGLGVAENIHASKVYGAVWNDYAEYRECKDNVEPGDVVVECGDDTLEKSFKDLQLGAYVVSDTYGFSIGRTEKATTPLAVCGRVLVKTLEERELYSQNIGRPVCATYMGKVRLMTDDEVIKYPHAIVGLVSAVPTYTTWGEENIEVNQRVWIKVK